MYIALVGSLSTQTQMYIRSFGRTTCVLGWGISCNKGCASRASECMCVCVSLENERTFRFICAVSIAISIGVVDPDGVVAVIVVLSFGV